MVALLPSTLLFSQELPFQEGEDLLYTITFKGGLVNADLVSLDLSLTGETDPVHGELLHAAAKINTFKFWDSFYRMRDVYETWFTADRTIRPIHFHREANEGKNYHSESWLDWSQDSHDVRVKIEKKNKPTIDTVYNEGQLMRDIINSVYVARILDYDAMAQGHVEKFIMTPYRDILELSVRLVGPEVKKISKGNKHNTLKLALAIKSKDVEKEDSSGFKVGASEDGNYMEGSEKIFMWVSDDANHVPLYFSAPASIGSIVGRLTEYSGLKYELTSGIPEEE